MYSPAAAWPGGSTAWMIHDSTGTPLGYPDGSNPYVFGTDGLGSVTSIVSPSGTQAASDTYGPYGETTADNGRQSAINLIRYTSGLSEPGSGLLKLGQRFYDAGRGRFTQQDSVISLGDPGKGNRYAYAGDSPVNRVDPTGKCPWGELLWNGIGLAQDSDIYATVYEDVSDPNGSVSQDTYAAVGGQGVAFGCMAGVTCATGGLGVAATGLCEVGGSFLGDQIAGAISG
ncbi:hypothetical protein GNZ18_22790 [Actinomadura sp. NEAU-AAG5]|uniref:Teneurin-like YD-shell domain-containing protein n=2 Tax=Actinomadura litoris TaxID=2678616 RepID=A0A7K1L4P9_9ACTN|nr:hypothetical protein [Actinomadura litoris]